MNTKPIKKNASRTNLTKLHQKDDADINYEDSPATNKKFWGNADIDYSDIPALDKSFFKKKLIKVFNKDK